MKNEPIFLDQLLGRVVVAGNNRSIGRLEELRAEQHGDYFDIVEFVIGAAGLMERLNVGLRALFGMTGRGKVARWDQIDISDPLHPRLTCPSDQLRKLQE
jgi:hypothetical protein